MAHHLLLIRDDVWSIRYVIDLLRARGYTVATASNFEFTTDSGLADNFDLIVIDHAGPRLNAMEICAELRQRNVEAPVVVLAPRDHVRDRSAIVDAGADDSAKRSPAARLGISTSALNAYRGRSHSSTAT